MFKLLKLTIPFLILIPSVALANLDAEVSLFSNYIWRGTTFSENKPVIQGDLSAENSLGFYAGTFFSNAEFGDEAMGTRAKVTQEVDLFVGKRFILGDLDMSFSYYAYYFPGAEVFNSDEWNLLLNYKQFILELSYLDDYFGFQSAYRYIRAGYVWDYTQTLKGILYVGYNAFDRPKGNIKSTCLDASCSSVAETTSGAGNPDYVDVMFVNRKVIENGVSLDFSVNWTNRYQYTVKDGEVHLNKARDFAVIVGMVIPVAL